LDQLAEDIGTATDDMLESLFQEALLDSKDLRQQIFDISEALSKKIQEQQELGNAEETTSLSKELGRTMQGVEEAAKDTELAAGPQKVAELSDKATGIVEDLETSIQQGIVDKTRAALFRAKSRLVSASDRGVSGMDKVEDLTRNKMEDASKLMSRLQERGMRNPEVAQEAIGLLQGHLDQVSEAKRNIKYVTDAAQNNLGGNLEVGHMDTTRTKEKNSMLQVIKKLNVVTKSSKETTEQLNAQAAAARQGVQESSEAMEEQYKNAYDTIRLLRDPVTHMLDKVHDTVEAVTWDARRTAKAMRSKQREIQAIANRIRVAANVVEDGSRVLGAAKNVLGMFGFR